MIRGFVDVCVTAALKFAARHHRVFPFETQHRRAILHWFGEYIRGLTSSITRRIVCKCASMHPATSAIS